MEIVLVMVLLSMASSRTCFSSRYISTHILNWFLCNVILLIYCPLRKALIRQQNRGKDVSADVQVPCARRATPSSQAGSGQRSLPKRSEVFCTHAGYCVWMEKRRQQHTIGTCNRVSEG